MYLIADSGSTKCKWRLVNFEGENLREFRTIGFNPFFHSTEVIKSELWESDDALIIKDKVTHVFFYGAGCSSQKFIKIVEDALKAFFINSIITVDHDLVSASYSTYTGNPAITCILGTGSNSSYFDGERVKEEIPSLAYILGDEASGSYFGKKLLKEFCYNRLPADIWEEFNSEFRLSEKDIIHKVYSEPDANIFLSGFMPFISRYKDYPLINKWLVEGFREFMDIHVKCFPNWKTVEVSFVGSVAVYFKDELIKACELEKVPIKNIVDNPLDCLVDYHREYIFPSL